MVAYRFAVVTGKTSLDQVLFQKDIFSQSPAILFQKQQ
jgi:hypothetical protein